MPSWGTLLDPVKQCGAFLVLRRRMGWLFEISILGRSFSVCCLVGKKDLKGKNLEIGNDLFCV